MNVREVQQDFCECINQQQRNPGHCHDLSLYLKHTVGNVCPDCGSHTGECHTIEKCAKYSQPCAVGHKTICHDRYVKIATHIVANMEMIGKLVWCQDV